MKIVPNPLKTKWQQKFLLLNCVHQGLQDAANEVEFFCNRWVIGDTNEATMVLVGQSGCGKTHMLKAIESFCRGAQALAHRKRSERARDVRSRVPSVMYAYWPTIASELAKGRDWAMEDATESDILLWDDFGSENDPWKAIADRACQILSRRERKFTAITTNIKPEDWPTRFDQRINDRLFRNSVIVDLYNVPSYATR